MEESKIIKDYEELKFAYNKLLEDYLILKETCYVMTELLSSKEAEILRLKIDRDL